MVTLTSRERFLNCTFCLLIVMCWSTILLADKFSIVILVLTTVEGLLSTAVEGLDQEQPVRRVSFNKFATVSHQSQLIKFTVQLSKLWQGLLGETRFYKLSFWQKLGQYLNEGLNGFTAIELIRGMKQRIQK